MAPHVAQSSLINGQRLDVCYDFGLFDMTYLFDGGNMVLTLLKYFLFCGSRSSRETVNLFWSGRYVLSRTKAKVDRPENAA